MTEHIDNLFQAEDDAWLNALPEYQKERVLELQSTGMKHEEIAEKWLSAIPNNTVTFGTEDNKKVFLKNVGIEIEKLLCGDESYNEQRKNIISSTDIVHTSFVSMVSVAIAPALGTSAIFIAPVVVLFFTTFGKITLNAWCTTRKEQKEENIITA